MKVDVQRLGEARHMEPEGSGLSLARGISLAGKALQPLVLELAHAVCMLVKATSSCLANAWGSLFAGPAEGAA